ncbi:MAG: SpoIIE family protein phosphatase [Mycobacteriales bacterium]
MAADRATSPEPARRRVVDAGGPSGAALVTAWFRALYEAPLLFSGILDQQGRLLDANELSVEGCGLDRDEVIGRPFWDCPWWNQEPEVSMRVRGWCERSLRTGESLRAPSRYFLGDETPRMVDLSLVRVRGDEGTMPLLVACGLDITDALAAREAERRADERLHRLVRVALELAGAKTLDDLTEIVVDRALPVLGADGGAVAVREPPDRLRLAVSDRLGEHVRVRYGDLPLDSPLAGPYSARTGERLLLPTRASGLAFCAEMGSVYEDTERLAWACLPMRAGGRLLGALLACWREEREFGADEVGILDAFAAQCAQALDRIQHLQARREAALVGPRRSGPPQRSLLAPPPDGGSRWIAARHRPAAQEGQIGGDWYDAFGTAAGATILVVGDVTGDDRTGAAMGQLRDLLRGLAYDSDDSPAVLLARLDRALHGLEVDTLATAVLVRVERPEAGIHRLRWSNAGHLPPLLREPDGTVQVLADTHDLLLGIRPGIERTERALDLPAGSSLLLYTDGLVDCRQTVIDDGIRRLARLFAELGDRAPGEVGDALLAASGAANEDDVALLVLRCGTEDAA